MAGGGDGSAVGAMGSSLVLDLLSKMDPEGFKKIGLYRLRKLLQLSFMQNIFPLCSQIPKRTNYQILAASD